MATLIFRRPSAYRDFFRRYAIFVDRTCVGYIRAGETVRFEVSAGIKSAYLRIDGYGSPEITILATDAGAIILDCLQTLASPFTRTARRHFEPNLGHIFKRPLQYLLLRIEQPEQMIHSFLQQAWYAVQYQYEERGETRWKSRFGLTAGDLSILYLARRHEGASMMTERGSANDIVWAELERIGWLSKPLEQSPSLPDRLVVYHRTDQGRSALINIFGL